MDDPTQRSRGRARGRSRGFLVGQEPPDIPAAPGVQRQSPDDEGMDLDNPPMDYRGLCGSEGSDSPPSNGNGSGNGSANSPNGSPEIVVPQMPVRGFRTEQPDFLRTRPEGFIKQGNSGLVKKMVANYFQLRMKQSMTLRMHLVTFNPQVDETKIRKALLRQRKSELEPYLFDGMQFFTTRTLQDHLVDQDLEVFFEDKPEKIYTMRIRFTRTCSTTEPIAFQLYNILIKECQKELKLDLIGRHYYDNEQRICIQNHRLEMWPGYITSMRQHETDVLLNVDITFKVLRMDHVFSLMRMYRSQDASNYKALCEAAIVGTIVMTRYNRKTYRVDEIDWNKNPTHSFIQSRKGVEREITFIDYFNETYHTKIESAGQPLLISHPKLRDVRRDQTGGVALIPELCYQTGLNSEMRENFTLMKAISNNLHMSPADRLTQVRAFITRVRQSEPASVQLEKWGVKFNPDPVEVRARIVPAEQIMFASGMVYPNDFSDWSMAFRKEKMLTCNPLERWVMIVSIRDAQDAGFLVSSMQKVAGPIGYKISNPVTIRVQDGNARSLIGGINDAMTRAKGKLDMAVIILPTKKLDVYAAVKRTCSIDYGTIIKDVRKPQGGANELSRVPLIASREVPSQCFVSKNLQSKGLMSICTKMVIQMNAKQGGQPWSVVNPLKGIMVIGFDVHHGGGKSTGAMTATMSNTLATYFSTITEQAPGLEIGSGIGLAFEKCLRAYAKTNNGELPSRIMFYRDGVGEGQLIAVQRTEISSCQLAMKSVYQGMGKPRPKFSFIVVTKRTNTRLFNQQGEGHRSDWKNPAPGTVVDEVITCPEKYDFYLVPQCVRQGTITPVCYNVLIDESGLDPDKMQRFTYKLCHLYFNWSGTVSVPAPCQYAHKLAFLTGTALEQAVSDRLSNYLHFL